jgi:sugar/nucleoside kinase (ribokinase family)
MEAPVVDANGAGDSLAVGFLASYVLDGYSLPDSVFRGQIAARHTCTLKATSSNLITRQKLDQIFRARSR